MNVFAPEPILIVGAGSIGRRHLGNLRTLGAHNLAVCEPHDQRRASVAEDGTVTFATLERAIEELRPAAALICTPPSQHLAPALALVRAGADVFVEKPVAPTLDGIDELGREAGARSRIIQVGYNLRFHPVLQTVKALLDAGAIGRPLHLHAQFGQYLPDWRPAVDYRASYSARAAMGGGILLDASHEIDYVTWLLGEPATLACFAGKASDLEVDVEDNATLMLGYAHDVHAVIHLDFVRRGYRRTLEIVGETGNILADLGRRTVALERGRDEITNMPVAGDDMYVAELQDFLACCRERRAPAVGLREGTRALGIVLAAKAAAAEGGVRKLASRSGA
jgi:predicted dehydrogenase